MFGNVIVRSAGAELLSRNGYRTPHEQMLYNSSKSQVTYHRN